ncbi:hypothetical protein IE81DRAFT_350537 [Ceraceosorus guamensis]|uniref:Uncharacterized protein n=1 Tax=Ceraceosorus guamensis TaxID=1522189 RepID=A0A316VRK0_9BASI|nr:hypothetical protein IE81DRAFT_350537 [Ceraceosorus guamensis]PWN39033.1 hypothetical protein IE81DRAFT_350537 [Ceraceosorus guamensis]
MNWRLIFAAVLALPTVLGVRWHGLNKAGDLNDPSTQLNLMIYRWNNACSSIKGYGELKPNGIGEIVCHCTFKDTHNKEHDYALGTVAYLGAHGYPGWEVSQGYEEGKR